MESRERGGVHSAQRAKKHADTIEVGGTDLSDVEDNPRSPGLVDKSKFNANQRSKKKLV